MLFGSSVGSQDSSDVAFATVSVVLPLAIYLLPLIDPFFFTTLFLPLRLQSRLLFATPFACSFMVFTDPVGAVQVRRKE